MIASNPARRVLVTGANGFVGARLCRHLVDAGHCVKAVVRDQSSSERLATESQQTEISAVGDLLYFADWHGLLHGIDAVVHLVARTHVTDEFGTAAIQEYRRTNVELTRRLAKACKRNGVRRFVYMSSIKAVGNGGPETYTEGTVCRPEDSYGVSKLEAERQVRSLLGDGDCDYVVLRPPLIHGPGVQGNFLRLLQLVDRGIPLPSVLNSRSMVHVDNLVEATTRCLLAPEAANRCFHVADAQPISTSELIQSMAIGLDRPHRLVPVPKSLLRGVGQTFGKAEEIKRLVGSLTMSTDLIARELQWRPATTTRDGVIATSKAYRNTPWSSNAKSTNRVKSTQGKPVRTAKSGRAA